MYQFQDDPALVKEVRKDGCYFLTLLWAGAFVGRRPVNVTQINTIYARAVANGFMRGDCYVLRPDQIIAEGVGGTRTVQINGPLRVAAGGNEWLGPATPRADSTHRLICQRWQTPEVGHFTGALHECAGVAPIWSKRGTPVNSFVLAALYDSYGLSRSRAWGEPRSMRVFDLKVKQ